MKQIKLETVSSPIGDLNFYQGIGDKQINQLISYTHQDSQVAKFTHDLVRFKDSKSARDWFKTGRRAYVLSDRQGNLLGLMWVADKILPKREYIADFDHKIYGTTLAIRLYEQSRGKGLAAGFLKKVMEREGVKGFWLEVHSQNEPALRVYRKIGFQAVSKSNPENRIIMIYPKR